MASPVGAPSPDVHDIDDPKVELALEEGHDADIPSNISPGVHDSKRESRQTDRDLEKDSQDDATSIEPAEERKGDGGDPNIVWWDGDDDPHNPLNWSSRKKWSLIGVLSLYTLITPLASSMFAPAVPLVQQDLHNFSTELATFVVSVFVLGYAVGPLIIAPLSELYGRLPVYNVSIIIFTVFTACCGASNSMGMLVAFRFLAGFIGVVPLTIGGGTIADLMPVEKRAGAMAIWSIGPMFGPVVGPVAGGYLAQAKGWRWIFWLLTIVSGTFSIVAITFLRETYAPVILARKAARLRTETGNSKLRSKLASDIAPSELFKMSLSRPGKMLLFSPICTICAVFAAVAYGILYLLFTTFTFVYEETYHWSSGTVGLSYIPTGIGMLFGAGLLGRLSDRAIRRVKDSGKEVKPEHRLPYIITLPGSIAFPAGLFIYGWSADKQVFWIVPLIGTAFVGFGLLSIMMYLQTYLIDTFTVYAASTIAANTILRSLFGAFLPLCALQMYAKLGLGWGNSLLGFLAAALIPVPIVLRLYGERIRTNPRFQVKF